MREASGLLVVVAGIMLAQRMRDTERRRYGAFRVPFVWGC
jgi:hypothetical protein